MSGVLREVNIKFDKCPFYWGEDVIFLESGYNFNVNRFISTNLTVINKMLKRYENEYRQDFIYFPLLCKEYNAQCKYYAPWGINETPISSSLLLQFVHGKTKRGSIPPCFIRHCNTREGSSFLAYEFNLDEWDNGFTLVEEIFKRFSQYNIPKGSGFNSSIVEREPNGTADDNFDANMLQLMLDIHEKIQHLRLYGVSEWALQQLIKPDIKLSRIAVTYDCKIILPDYEDIEIRMEPLVKSVYLLFLRHAEGIKFKDLPDYRTELYSIYRKVKECSSYTTILSEEKIKKSIDDVTKSSTQKARLQQTT